jgi:acyl dehydratase
VTEESAEVITRFEMTVERGKIREFARATGSTNPAYLEEDTPPVPPTFFTSAVFWQPADAKRPYEALGMDQRRVLHGEQEFRFFGPPVRAGARLSVEVRIESVVEKEGRRGGTMRLARVVTEFTDDQGQLVARARSTTIETGET